MSKQITDLVVDMREMSEDHKAVKHLVLGPPEDPTKGLVFTVQKVANELSSVTKILKVVATGIGLAVLTAIMNLVLK